MTDKTFSDFIRHATPEEKAKVYAEVMDEACEMQRKVMGSESELKPCPFCGSPANAFEYDNYGGGIEFNVALDLRLPVFCKSFSCP